MLDPDEVAHANGSLTDTFSGSLTGSLSRLALSNGSQTLRVKASRLPLLVGELLAPPLGLKGQCFDCDADKQREVGPDHTPHP